MTLPLFALSELCFNEVSFVLIEAVGEFVLSVGDCRKPHVEVAVLGGILMQDGVGDASLWESVFNAQVFLLLKKGNRIKL